MIKRTFKLLGQVVATLLLLSGPTFAADLNDLRASPFDVQSLSTSLLNRMPVFIGGFAFLALLYSGGMYVMSIGDATKMENAKKNITWAIIGIIAVSLVGVAIKLVITVTNGVGNFTP